MTDELARIIDTHRTGLSHDIEKSGPDVFYVTCTGCDWELEHRDGTGEEYGRVRRQVNLAHAEHVAGLVAEALGLQQEWALHDMDDGPGYWPDLNGVRETLEEARKDLMKCRGAWTSGGRPVYHQVVTRYRTDWTPVEPAVDNRPIEGAK